MVALEKLAVIEQARRVCALRWMKNEKSGCEMRRCWPMWSIVLFRLFVRMINSGVVLVLAAIPARTSPLRTMYSCFSGERIIGEQDLDVHFAEKILRFLEMEAGRDISGENERGRPALPSACPFLSKLGRA